MAQYRFLQDAYIDRYYQAGDVASTSDVGGTLPANFIPPAAVDPLDQSAVNAFHAAGPQQLGAVRVGLPKTYWVGTPLGAVTKFQLTGLGANLPPIMM
jgi:hypothetical protein